MRTRRTAALAVAALAMSTAPAQALLSGAASPTSVVLDGQRSAWVAQAPRVGDLADDADVAVEVVLPWRAPREARALAQAVANPASSQYRQFLSPEQWRARFAPSPSDVRAVQRHLRAAGLQLGTAPANRVVVPARGSAAAVERAFGVSLGRYRHVGTGLVLRAPDGPVRLPAALAALGVGVRGLEETALLIRPGSYDDDPPPHLPLPDEPPTPADTPPPTAVLYGAPCSAHHAAVVDKRLPKVFGAHQPAVTCATSHRDLARVYGADAAQRRGVDGTGSTIVITGSHAVKRLPGDVAEWSKRRGIKPLRPGQIRQISHPGAYQMPVSEPYLRPTVWATQTATLVETIRTVAPGADVLYVGSTSAFDIVAATLIAVDGDFGDVVMNGWYTVSEDVPAPERDLVSRIAEQAAAQGISLLFASGDLADGSTAGSSQPGAVYPASEPMATAVGATSLLLGKGGKLVAELGWGKTQATLVDGAWEDDDPSTYRGSGGGTSRFHALPDYQAGIVPADLADGRAVPDLAVMGDAETAMSIGYTMRFPDGTDRYAERRLASGTASTALVAGLLALGVDAGDERLGFVNPLLYGAYRAQRTLFRDVMPGARRQAGVRVDFTNGSTPEDGTERRLKTFEEFTSNVPRRGYDTVTGLGAPTPALVALLTR